MPEPNTGHLWCCCDPIACPLQCTFDTSYLMGGMSGTLQAVWEEKIAVDCPVCDGGIYSDLISAYGISVTWNQTTSVTLTRYATPGGGCCYAASGNVGINWSFSADEQIWCCIASPPYACSLTNTFTGYESVPFCYTVTCAQSKGVSYWLHSLTICDFNCVTGIELMAAPAPGTCGFEANCNDLPLSRVGLRMLGAKYSWYTTIKSLDLLFPVDWTPIGVCGPLGYCQIEYIGQDEFGNDENCMPRVAQSANSFGPFSPIVQADWGASPPAPCSHFATPVFRATFGTCLGSQFNYGVYGCADNLTSATSCCDAGLSSAWSYPTFT